MKHIGQKIKELRKKNDMTQEKLADYLFVSYQAVSKWETGAASPDLSLIVPLAKILHVTTDELFNLDTDQSDPRRKELDDLFDSTWKSGDMKVRYETALARCTEYPGDFKYLLDLAEAEEHYTYHHLENDPQMQKEFFERSVKHCEMILEDCTDQTLRDNAIEQLVSVLPELGRHEEAVAYARQHPRANDLLINCLTGEEGKKHRQAMLFHKITDVLLLLDRSLPALEAKEKIIQALIPDGNYLYWHDWLTGNDIWKAQHFVRRGENAEAFALLRSAKNHMREYEKVLHKNTPSAYTAPLLNRLTYDPNNVTNFGTNTPSENFLAYLSMPVFDKIRETEEFQEISTI
ncbi:MAG: helix-turn-helix domain-containing protein [Clostridia bacterium]|nr:helix-turn-helix domain-containing protein [Clostridia bacterium]